MERSTHLQRDVPTTLGQPKNHARRKQDAPYRYLQEYVYPEDGVDWRIRLLLREVFVVRMSRSRRRES